jgi:hypothetical protein
MQQAGKGASVNACADQMLDVNERLNSLVGYDMRDVTTADSDETTLNGTLKLPSHSRRVIYDSG